MPPTLALLDGNSIAYRAFFALPEDLATTWGQVTNAVYGFTRMLIKLLGDHRPDGVVVTWDVSRQSFRSERYAEYKAQRRAAPDNLRSQLPIIDEVLAALDIAQVRREGFEADDLIATLTARAVDQGWEVLVVTGDRDAFQLIGDHVKVLYTRRGITDTVVADAAYVEERYGITPGRYIDFAALRGDPSDNLPGVEGVGEKTAAKLVSGYGDLEGIYQHLDDQSPRLRQSLAARREQVFLNRELMALVTTVDLTEDPADFVRGEWAQGPVKELFESLEFHSLWEDLLAVQPLAGDLPAEVLDVEARVVSAPDEVAGLVAEGGRLVIDLVHAGGEPFGLAVLSDKGGAAIVAVGDLGPLAPALASPEVGVVGHDAKEVIRWLAEHGYEVDGLAMDTALAAYVLNPSGRTYDLDGIAGRYLGLEVSSPDLEPDGQGTLAFDSVPDIDGAARRVVAIDRLAERMWAELEARDERALFERFELPLVGVLARMESVGIGVDGAYLTELGAELRGEIGDLESRIHELAGEPFNVNSTDQLRVVLFERLGLPVQKKTSTGKPSTDASVLAKLDHPIIEALLRHRELEKLRSTYVDGYLPLVTQGRIHTRFNQMAATTGRLSSDRPNLQNIPVRSETGRTVRRAFVPRPGWSFFVADYSQIELRVLAHMSGDQGLLEAFTTTHRDIHTATAARVWGVPVDEVTAEMRRRAKMINFGLLYGMEAFGLASRLGISRDEARHHIDTYFEQFPDVQAFMQGVVSQARNQGYTTTLFGRRRYLPELKSDNFRIRQMGERMALNAPVQGTAADIIKRAMIDLDAELRRRDAASALLLQIHDELVLEAPPDELDGLASLTVQVMEDVAQLAVPLVVDVAIGSDLADVKR